MTAPHTQAAVQRKGVPAASLLYTTDWCPSCPYRQQCFEQGARQSHALSALNSDPWLITAVMRYSTVAHENRAEKEQGRVYVLVAPALPSGSCTVLGSSSENGQWKLPLSFSFGAPDHTVVDASAKMYRSVVSLISSPVTYVPSPLSLPQPSTAGPRTVTVTAFIGISSTRSSSTDPVIGSPWSTRGSDSGARALLSTFSRAHARPWRFVSAYVCVTGSRGAGLSSTRAGGAASHSRGLYAGSSPPSGGAGAFCSTASDMLVLSVWGARRVSRQGGAEAEAASGAYMYQCLTRFR